MKPRASDVQLEALAYAFKLFRAERLSWSKIVTRVNERGFRNTRRNPYTADNLRWNYHELNSGRFPELSDYIAKQERDEASARDSLSRHEAIEMMRALEARLTKLVETNLQAAIGAYRADASCDNAVPPLPPKGGEFGRKFKGEKSDVRARIDSVLFRLLSRECGREFNGNMSRCLDAILWRYYGKPKLSFEE